MRLVVNISVLLGATMLLAPAPSAGFRTAPPTTKTTATAATTTTTTTTMDEGGSPPAAAADGRPSAPLSARPLQRRPKPPRAFCVRISRAIPSESRCFKHLAETSPGRPRPDQLVYVRWETLGDKISQLGTRPINEHLLEGLLNELMATQEPAENHNAIERDPSTDASARSPDLAQNEADKIRAQIMGVTVTKSGDGGGGGGGFSSCRLGVEKLACRLVYPSCHFRLEDGGALVRPPCREDCLALRDAICPNLNWPLFNQLLQSAFNKTLKSTINALDLLVDGDELAASIASDHSHISSPNPLKIRAPGDLNESLHYYWPHERSIERCEQLPPFRLALADRLRASRSLDSPSGSLNWQHKHHWLSCSNAHLTEIIGTRGRDISFKNSTNHQEDCLEDLNGAAYLGRRNVTRSGWTCQHWNEQTPHKHPTSELLFDNMRKAHNFCRNPGGLELLPWCYTTNPDVRWDFCNIEACRK